MADRDADFNCDVWRASYDSMSFLDHRRAYDQISRGSPEQQCVDQRAALRAIDDSVREVVEIGGWRGELAQAALDAFPQIDRWWNYEICSWALDYGNRCEHEEYEAMELTDWPWLIDLPEADLFVASHVIEHNRAAEFSALLPQLASKYRRLHFQIPLPLGTRPNWSGYDGCHIFEWSWEETHDLIIASGYELIDVDRTLTCRTYEQ